MSGEGIDVVYVNIMSFLCIVHKFSRKVNCKTCCDQSKYNKSEIRRNSHEKDIVNENIMC